jgi:hypothetical protein
MEPVSENKAKRGPDQRIKVLPVKEGEKAAPRRKEKK